MDKFHEQLLRTKKSPLYRILTAYMYISIVLLTFSMLYAFLSLSITTIIFAVIFLASFFIVRRLRDRSYKEFEYIFTNGNLQVDVIYNMKKRKTLYDIDIKNMEDYGRVEDVKIGNGVKKIACVPWDYKGQKYVFLTSGKGKQAVYISPNDELTKLINVYNVRRPR